MLFLEINGISCRKRQEPVGGNKTMANTRQTQADPQQQSAYAICGCCGGEIYLGQLYYEMDDRYVCPECLGEYAKSYFLSRQRTAMLPQWRA